MSDYDKEHATTYLKKHFKKFDFFPERFISKDFIKDVELTIDNYEDFKFAEKIITLSKSNIFKLGIDEIQKIYLDSHIKHNSIRKWSKGIWVKLFIIFKTFLGNLKNYSWLNS